jgi:hypothetical protein
MSVIFEKRNKNFSFIRFLSEAALTTDSTRPYFRLIHVELDGETKILTTTDGRRLHQLTVPDESLDIEPGDYTVIKKSDIITLTLTNTPIDFPNWRRIIPKNTVDLYRGMSIDKRSMEEPVYLLNRLDVAIKLDYLSDLNGFTWNVRQDIKGRSHAVIFESGALKAVIMPLNVDYNRWKDEAEKTEKRLAFLENQAEPEKTDSSVALKPEPAQPVSAKPSAKAAKSRRKFAADTRWIPNRLGTKQVIVCRF